MSRGEDDGPSRLLLFSEQHQEPSQTNHFISVLHEKYGIPVTQLEHIYFGTKSLRSEQSEETTQLDYGQKLTLNHNILKEMISIIDNRETFAKNMSLSQAKTPNRRNTISIAGNKVQEKLKEVKNKLQDLIRFIGQEQGNPESIQIKKVVNLSDINQASYFNASLQYSKDESQSTGKEKEMMSKLDQAKEATSEIMLNPSSPQSFKMSLSKEQFLKSSLDRISEVQSGETLEKDSEQSYRKRTPKKLSQGEVQVNRSQQNQDSNQQLDETGRMILTTINKKIIKTSTITENEKSGTKKSIPSPEHENGLGSEIKKSKFWRSNPGKLDTLPYNVAVSKESLEESKAFQRSSRFKYDEFNKGFTFKSLESIQRQSREEIYRRQHKQSQKIFIQEHFNQSKHYIKQNKLAKSSETINKYYLDQSFSNPNIPREKSPKNLQSTSPKRYKESMIVKSFPSKPITSQSIGPKTPHQRSLQSLHGPPKRQFVTAHFLDENRPKMAMPLPNTTSPANIKRAQSVPFLSYRQNSTLSQQPQIIYAQNPKTHLFVRQPSIQARNEAKSSQKSIKIPQATPKQRQRVQSPRIVNPFIVASKIQPSRRSDVYFNIYEEIANRSQSSKKSPVQQSPQKQVPSSKIQGFSSTEELNINESRLRKKGIMLMSARRHFDTKRNY